MNYSNQAFALVLHKFNIDKTMHEKICHKTIKICHITVIEQINETNLTVVGQLPETIVIQYAPNQKPIIDYTLGKTLDSDFETFSVKFSQDES